MYIRIDESDFRKMSDAEVVNNLLERNGFSRLERELFLRRHGVSTADLKDPMTVINVDSIIADLNGMNRYYIEIGEHEKILKRIDELKLRLEVLDHTLADMIVKTDVLTEICFHESGAEILTSYCPLMWSNSLRRPYLAYSKHFICNCQRCCDPTDDRTTQDIIVRQMFREEPLIAPNGNQRYVLPVRMPVQFIFKLLEPGTVAVGEVVAEVLNSKHMPDPTGLRHMVMQKKRIRRSGKEIMGQKGKNEVSTANTTYFASRFAVMASLRKPDSRRTWTRFVTVNICWDNKGSDSTVLQFTTPNFYAEKRYTAMFNPRSNSKLLTQDVEPNAQCADREPTATLPPTRLRRFSTSCSPVVPLSAGGPSSPKLHRVTQLRREESADVLCREAAHERELNSAMHVSLSCEDLSLISDRPKTPSTDSSEANGKNGKGLHLNLTSTPTSDRSLCSTPSPTRMTANRQFITFKSSLTPSPNRSFRYCVNNENSL
ncbi:unnamed protein product [Nesidiocoris tenuis]|uniref:Uncharacterized protein n=1 Tax=Nesidiocoris tenuis TaxID=355587 RepID=A0A6H5HGY2_9HEMI|nr:unnamed protein product [Nesidiocoris tenuis]